MTATFTKAVCIHNVYTHTHTTTIQEEERKKKNSSPAHIKQLSASSFLYFSLSLLGYVRFLVAQFSRSTFPPPSLFSYATIKQKQVKKKKNETKRGGSKNHLEGQKINDKEGEGRLWENLLPEIQVNMQNVDNLLRFYFKN